MASSKVEIWNVSVSHLGSGKVIGSDTEASEEARACSRMWDLCLDKVLRAGPWSFATRIEAAQLIEEDPNDEWLYSYRKPTDCISIKRVLSGARNDDRQSRVAFKEASDSSGNLFFTDEEDAYIEVVYRNTNTQFYTPGFTLAVSYKLASMIAPKLTKGDPFKMKQDMERMYLMSLAEALAADGNEDQPDEEPDSEFIRTRN